jgi:hypothetical protein
MASNALCPSSKHHYSLGLDRASAMESSCTSLRTNAALLRIVVKKWDTTVAEDLVADDDASAKIGPGSNQTRACNPRPTSQAFEGSENTESSSS